MSASANCFGDPRYQLDIAFRFAAQLPDKVRACVDLRRPRTDIGAVLSSPITLPTWDIIAQLCLKIADFPPRWGARCRRPRIII